MRHPRILHRLDALEVHAQVDDRYARGSRQIDDAANGGNDCLDAADLDAGDVPPPPTTAEPFQHVDHQDRARSGVEWQGEGPRIHRGA